MAAKKRNVALFLRAFDRPCSLDCILGELLQTHPYFTFLAGGSWHLKKYRLCTNTFFTSLCLSQFIVLWNPPHFSQHCCYNQVHLLAVSIKLARNKLVLSFDIHRCSLNIGVPGGVDECDMREVAFCADSRYKFNFSIFEMYAIIASNLGIQKVSGWSQLKKREGGD